MCLASSQPGCPPSLLILLKPRLKGRTKEGPWHPPEMEMNLGEHSRLGECVLFGSVFMFLEEAWLSSGMGPFYLGAGCSLQRGTGKGHFSKPHPLRHDGTHH